jgi:hypothetical protein
LFLFLFFDTEAARVGCLFRQPPPFSMTVCKHNPPFFFKRNRKTPLFEHAALGPCSLFSGLVNKNGTYSSRPATTLDQKSTRRLPAARARPFTPFPAVLPRVMTDVDTAKPAAAEDVRDGGGSAL